jgi:hypothetical protein
MLSFLKHRNLSNYEKGWHSEAILMKLQNAYCFGGKRQNIIVAELKIERKSGYY